MAVVGLYVSTGRAVLGSPARKHPEPPMDFSVEFTDVGLTSDVIRTII
jgi:hypothetical protein